MAAKKTSQKTAPAAPPIKKKRNPDAFEVVESEDTRSQTLAKLATGGVLCAATLKRYSGAGEDMEVPDLVTEMRKAGDEVVDGDMGRVERMLANQAMTLDAIFNNMAQRSHKQDTFKGIEVLMRLALKAQAQARATAEALALLKNPMPYIKQANIAQGHQQVNNTYASASGYTNGKEDVPEQYAQGRTHAGNFQSTPNKLLEADHGQRLDTRAQGTAGRANQKLESVG